MPETQSEPEAAPIVVTFVGYWCRVCGTPSANDIGIGVREIDGERHLCPVNHRLTRTRCETCGVVRPHVLDVPGIDDAADGRPIDSLAHPAVLDEKEDE